MSSRVDRWNDATMRARAELQAAASAMDALDAALEELRSVRDEYEEWRDGLPDSQQSSATAEKLNMVCDIDIPDVGDALIDVKTALDEAENADLPLGYGRD